MVMNVQVQRSSLTSVRVSWDGVNITEITSYIVYYSLADGNGQLRGQMNKTIPKSQTSVVIDNLMIDEQYHFQVVAIVEERGKRIMGRRSMEITFTPIKAPVSGNFVFSMNNSFMSSYYLLL